MKEKVTFQQGVQADIALIEAKLIRFKVRGMGFIAAARDRHGEQVDQLEERIDALNERLGDFEKVDGRLWGDFKAAIEKSMHELQTLLEKTTQSFVTESGAAELHGGDDGPFPYGEGLSGHPADTNTILNKELNYGRQRRKKRQSQESKTG